MTDDAQRARRRAHNAHALERCNAMGRTAGSILWQPLENRAGKWFMPDGSELSEAPIEWRSERLSTILDEMDAIQAVAPVSDAAKAYVESLDMADWKAAVDAQFNEGAARLNTPTHSDGTYRSPPPSTITAGDVLSKFASHVDSGGSVNDTISLEELEKAISDPDPMFAEVPEPFKKYRRSQIAELRPYVPGELLGDGDVVVSVSAEDVKAGSPRVGDMIARNPKNHADQWLVAEQYFKDNFEPI